ncbi:MAG: SpoIIE family protein phosphatase, partial [Crocinitomicaceae bacterium]|nr:SpoIIE family protein phosphatase [Crocinitomicaceae bacterium]
MKFYLQILIALLMQGYTFSQGTGVTIYSEEIQPLLDTFRTVALSQPDSCDFEFNAVYKKAIETKEYHAIAKAYNIRGIGYAYQNKIPEAIGFFIKANDVASKLPPTDILVDCRNNIGNMYITQGDTASAIHYISLGLEAAMLYGNLDRELITRIQLTSLEIDCGKLDQAFVNLEKLREQYDQISELDVKAYYHIARCRYFYELEKYDSALVHAEIGLKQYESLNDFIGMSTCNYYIGMNHLKMGNLNKAITHCQTSFNVADTTNLDIWKMQSCECLWEAYDIKGDYKKALEYHVKLTDLREQTKNDERIREITKLEMEVAFTETRMQDSLKAAEENLRLKSEQDLALQSEKSKNLILFIGLAFLGILALVLYRNFRSKQKDNQIILEQKNTVELKQQEIMDSISYAKRLQDAILPSSTQLNNSLPEHFIFYAPKDIVSGDFYWFESVSGTENTTLLAAADCTGHGVPGALVSVVCSNALRRSVREFGLRTPGEILDKVSSILVETFENDGNEVKDGMDAALISLSAPDQHGKRIVQFSGANNPLWVARQSEYLEITQKEDPAVIADETNKMALLEVKGDRQPVGKFVDKKAFLTTTLQLIKGDILYIFTDGFPDQFGGPKGKKFKYQTFKKLLLANAHLPMQKQKDILSDTL